MTGLGEITPAQNTPMTVAQQTQGITDTGFGLGIAHYQHLMAPLLQQTCEGRDHPRTTGEIVTRQQKSDSHLR